MKHVNSASFCAQHCLFQFKVGPHIKRHFFVCIQMLVPAVECKCTREMKPHFLICTAHVPVWENTGVRVSKLFPQAWALNLASDALISLLGITGRDDSYVTPNKWCSLSFLLLLFWPGEQDYYDGGMLPHPPMLNGWGVLWKSQFVTQSISHPKCFWICGVLSSNTSKISPHDRVSLSQLYLLLHIMPILLTSTTDYYSQLSLISAIISPPTSVWKLSTTSSKWMLISPRALVYLFK